MAGNDDSSFDLLGLGPIEVSPAVFTSPPIAASTAGPSQAATPVKDIRIPSDPARAGYTEPVIAYPPAWQQTQETKENSTPTSPVSSVVNVEIGDAACEVPIEELAAGHKRFSVRCEGRWRVRSAPSLSSKVIGTISNGTIVIGELAQSEFLLQSGSVHTSMPTRTPVSGISVADGGAIGSLWVRVHRFETEDPQGVSEIRRDAASGGVLYCLRRNALGYGLYELGVEPLDGALITLPEHLAAELRFDAQRAASDKTEDVSLTWKILGAAENLGRFFNQMGTAADEGGVNEDMKVQIRQRPDEVFEARQRDQLKKAAAALKKATQSIITKAGTSEADVLEGLPKEIARRFGRLRTQLAVSSECTSPLVLSPLQTQQQQSSPPSPTSPTNSGNAEQEQEKLQKGTIGDLQKFVELCERLERTGGWSELSSVLRQDVTNFSMKHAQDLEQHARFLARGGVGKDKAGSMDESTPRTPTSPVRAQTDLTTDFLLDFSPSATPASNQGYPSASKPAPVQSAKAFIPLLLPPPPPASGVSTGQLI